MKRVALLVLALAVATIADDEEKLLNHAAQEFESDVDTVQGCLKDATTTITEINVVMKKLEEMTSQEEIDEDMKEAITRHNSFLACMLEKTGLMEDKMLLTEKIIENVEKDRDKTTVPMPSKKQLTECINTLNESKNEMTREDMAFGLTLCFYLPVE